MLDFFFGYPAGWFTTAALIGTIFFALRMTTAMVGLDVDHGAVGHDLGGGGGGAGADDLHTDPGDAFKILSMQSLAAFLMGFGWAGLGGLRGSGLGMGWSVTVGVIGGVAMVWLLGWLLRMVYDLQASGNIPIAHVVGKAGDVYVTVPTSGGRGRVRVVVDGRERYFPALSESEELERGAQVRVERVNEDRTLVVRRA